MVLSALGIVFAMPGLIAITRRVPAFRADYAGITLADMPTSLAALRNRAMFIPWAEIDRIVLYPAAGPAEPGSGAPVQGIAVQRREEATAVASRPGPDGPQDHRLAAGPGAADRRDRGRGPGRAHCRRRE